LRTKGFVLIEVVIASIVTCLLVASFSYLSKRTIDSIKRSDEVTRDTISAKNIMEELRSLPFDIIFAYNGSKFNNEQGIIKIEKLGNDLAVITVNNSVELVTMRARY
jgi:Tfp pilus assembly protein PilV